MKNVKTAFLFLLLTAASSSLFSMHREIIIRTTGNDLEQYTVTETDKDETIIYRKNLKTEQVECEVIKDGNKMSLTEDVSLKAIGKTLAQLFALIKNRFENAQKEPKEIAFECASRIRSETYPAYICPSERR